MHADVTSARFERAMTLLLGEPDVAGDGAEGGYQHDPRDNGNAGGGGTNFGMTQPFYDRYRREVLQLSPRDVRYASEEEARDAYYHLVWIDQRVNARGVATEAPATGLVYFDGVVNQGPIVTGALQEMVGARVDHWFGPASCSRLRVAVGVHGQADPALAMQLLEWRRRRYEHLDDYSWAGASWRHRCNRIAALATLPWHWPDPTPATEAP